MPPRGPVSLPVVVAAAVAMVTGCTTAAARVAGPPSSVGTASSASITRPTGLSAKSRAHHLAGPEVARRIDVDGDGRLDRVSVVWKRVTSADNHMGVRTVVVRLASGSSLRRTVPAWGWGSPQGGPLGWAGTVHFPGMTGRQIVLLKNAGAANQFYEVLGDVNGVLAPIPTPGPDASGWNSGGSEGTGSGDVYCRVGVLYSDYATFTVHRRRERSHLRLAGYVWRDDGWVRVMRYVGPSDGYHGSTPRGDVPFAGC
jgi:hypothetical protein